VGYRYVLKIDIDVPFLDKTALSTWEETRRVILKHLGVRPIGFKYARTKHGWHVWVDIDSDYPLNDYYLAFLQFLLGDDHRRATFNLARAEAGSFKVFNVLFSKKLRQKWPMERLIPYVLKLITAWSLFEVVKELEEDVEL